jgi:hypothetical protein
MFADRVKFHGKGHRADKNPSLAIRELDDGRILLHCFAGCNINNIVSSIGLSVGDLFPKLQIHCCRPERRPFPAADVLRAISFEVQVVAVAGAVLVASQPFSDVDRERLMLAVARIEAALTAAGVHHG